MKHNVLAILDAVIFVTAGLLLLLYNQEQIAFSIRALNISVFTGLSSLFVSVLMPIVLFISVVIYMLAIKKNNDLTALGVAIGTGALGFYAFIILFAYLGNVGAAGVALLPIILFCYLGLICSDVIIIMGVSNRKHFIIGVITISVILSGLFLWSKLTSLTAGPCDQLFSNNKQMNEQIRQACKKDTKLQERAKELADCITYREVSQKGEENTNCIGYIAGITHNLEICDAIPLSHKSPDYSTKRKWCIAKVAKGLKDLSMCDQLSPDNDKYQCYSEIGSSNGDVKICELIPIQYGKDKCLLGILDERKDPAICVKITDKAIKEKCIDRTR